MFTVKVDLSSIMDNLNGDQIYILLVDPCKMKVIFEFKKWIQFLFSVDFCIRLVYEDAVIHDLEDINILSLLKSVKIEHSVPPKWADKVHDLLTEKNKFEEMFNIEMNSSGLSTDGPKSITEKSWRNMTKEKFISENKGQNVVSPDEKKAFCQETERDKDIQYCSVSPSSKQGLQIADNKKLIDGWKKNEFSDTFDMKRKNFGCTEVDSESFTPNKIKKVSDVSNTQEHLINFNLSKNLNKQLFADNAINGENNMLVEQLKTQGKKLPKVCSQNKSKNFIKPFCIGNMLNEMRAESFNKADENNIIVHTESEMNVTEFTDDKKISFQNENNKCQDLITFEKKVRKRIRKHKSKKKNADCEVSNVTVSSPISFSFSQYSNHKALSSGQKPKHIRFDIDVNDCDIDDPDNEIKNDANYQEYNGTKNSSSDNQDSKRLNDINVQELRNMIQEKRKILELNCNKEADTDRDSNSDLISSDGYCLNQKKVTGNQFLEDQTPPEGIEKKDEQDTIDAIFPRSIFDITANSKKKYFNPFVFNRFN